MLMTFMLDTIKKVGIWVLTVIVGFVLLYGYLMAGMYIPWNGDGYK